MIPPGHPSAAIDPFGFFVALIIIINVVSAFARRARQQRAATAQQSQQQSQPSSVQSRLDETMRKAAADAAATRQAQRARMEQAIRAAQARLQKPTQAPQIVVAKVPAPAPMVAMTAPQAEMLPTSDYAEDMSTMLMPTASTEPAHAPVRFPVLGSRFTGMELFVAAAIVGPPAALRSVGHTPAGW